MMGAPQFELGAPQHRGDWGAPLKGPPGGPPILIVLLQVLSSLN